MKAYLLKSIKSITHCLLLVSSLTCYAKESWVIVSNVNAPKARTLHTTVWTRERMIVWGGGPGNVPFFNTGGMYDPSADAWNPISVQNAPGTRSFHTAVWTGNRMIVWGGFNGKNTLNTGGMYDPITNTWSPISIQNAPKARGASTVVWTGDRMIIWGGQNTTSPSLNSGGMYIYNN